MALNWYPAPAKLNLFLHVLGRRADGYHDLQTVFRLIDRADRVGIGVRTDGEIRYRGPFAEDNLCVRAARLLRGDRGDLGCDIVLDKAIPAGAGLGGGSSDAAAVLVVLNRLWRLGLSRAHLMALALRLGADVPFFVFGRDALGEGVGERLTALALPPAWYCVITPQVSVSTKEIFSSGLTGRSKALTIPPFFPGLGRNDLESAVTTLVPEVAAALAWLKSRCPQARMTGSGSSVFAEVESEREARALQSAVPDTMRSFVARGLEQHPLRDWTS